MSERNPFDLPALERAEEEKAAKIARIREQTSADVVELMGSPSGRRLALWLLNEAGVFRSSYTGGPGVEFLEGKRSVGLVLSGYIHDACPGLYAKMIEEGKQDA